MNSLDGRVIAIAGAAGGLGPVVAARLAEAGATLALTDRDQGRLDALVADLGLDESRVDARVVDLLDEDAARGWAAALAERFGGVDGLLHLVGGWKGGEPLATTPLADYEWLHDLLVRTVIHTTRAFYEPLAASEHGRFVLVSSSQAQAPGRHQRRPTARPRRPPRRGRWRSGRLVPRGRLRGDGQHPGHQRDPHPAACARPTPTSRTGRSPPTEEIADALAFICSDAARKMNGKRLPLYP